MIFNELYSAYYNAVAKIITAVLNGKTDERTLNQIVCDNAFGESMLTVWPSLKNEKWQLVKADMTTPLRHIPTMPMTLIQKQWLKAVSLDPRIKLFGLDLSGLENVEPLFTPEDYLVYDQYSDGDPYEDARYIKHFRTILFALRHKKNIRIEMVNRKGSLKHSKRLERSIGTLGGGNHFIEIDADEDGNKYLIIHSGSRNLGTSILRK